MRYRGDRPGAMKVVLRRAAEILSRDPESMFERKERIEPFRGLFFNPGRCGDLAPIVAPPYDLIGPQRQEQLYQRSPYNVVRLELNREADRYRAAAEMLADWRRDGILERASAPAIHLYTQTSALRGGN